MSDSRPALPAYEGNPPALRVALCQVSTVEWRVDDNLERAIAALEQAAQQGAELAVTPECVLHGYAVRPDGMTQAEFQRRVAAVAEPLDGPRLARLRELARRRGIEVVVGFAELAAGGRVHNTAAYIGRDGAIVFAYRKVHCRRFESAEGDGAFTPGDRFHAVERAWGERRFRIGAMICFDREIPEATRCLRALGAELVVCPLATGTSRLDAWHAGSENESVTRTRAAENEQFIVVVNHAGRFGGGSFAVGPYGEICCQLGAEPEVRTVALPIGVVARGFHRDPWGWMGWGFRRPEVYARYLGHPMAAERG